MAEITILSSIPTYALQLSGYFLASGYTKRPLLSKSGSSGPMLPSTNMERGYIRSVRGVFWDSFCTKRSHNIIIKS